LEVSDDGIGLPPGFDIQQSDGLGLQIVKTLTTNELGGKLGVLPAFPTENGGTRIYLEIYC
jgi:two-component sensor histidine kinase